MSIMIAVIVLFVDFGKMGEEDVNNFGEIVVKKDLELEKRLVKRRGVVEYRLVLVVKNVIVVMIAG